MDLILKKTSPDEMKQYILPMILTTLESNNNQVQVIKQMQQQQQQTTIIISLKFVYTFSNYM